MIAKFAELPKWMLPGGQMWGDPRVQNHWNAVRTAKGMADADGRELSEEDMVSVLLGVMDGTPYTAETGQERRERDDYAPIVSSADFWVVWRATRDAALYEDRDRSWPDYIAWNEIDDIFVDDLTEEGVVEVESEPDLGDLVPGTSPWQEYIDDQRSRMVADMTSAAARGKKWARHHAFMVVALSALDRGESYARARELAFMAYHASFTANVGVCHPRGISVKTAEFTKDGKRKDVWRLLPYQYVEMALPYLHKAAAALIQSRMDEYNSISGI